MVDKKSYHLEFNHVFQPIYHLESWITYGYEAFLRANNNQPPLEWFNKSRHNKEDMFFNHDMESISNAMMTFYKERPDTYHPQLFINVFPINLRHPSFISSLKTIIQNNQIFPNRIVLEISEKDCYPNHPSGLKKIVTELKELGIRLAIDHFGSGYASLELLIELEPHFIKLGDFFTNNLAMSQKKQTFIQMLVDYTTNDNHIILKNIETASDLALAKSLGVHFGQGHIFDRTFT